MTYYPFDTQMCELKFASWTTEVTRVSAPMNPLCKTDRKKKSRQPADYEKVWQNTSGCGDSILHLITDGFWPTFEVMADGFPQINMSIGDISAKEILSLYSPSGKSNIANFPISMWLQLLSFLRWQPFHLLGVFELKKFWAERHEEKDPCCVDPFADVT